MARLVEILDDLEKNFDPTKSKLFKKVGIIFLSIGIIGTAYLVSSCTKTVYKAITSQEMQNILPTQPYLPQIDSLK